ncbi:hypothetical protein [Inhella proteolytica]|uniref:Uncharacterized protein n=1 Tax=Inhella proteolytica TaxID=2795029 RepID=A0A931J0L3_9BURK|nr:hypothetical protein [Inhella proteolytica]MBH9576161.1 hypothetical protein [Inhella proteolytica]
MNLPRISDALTLGTMAALTAISVFVVLTYEPAVPPAPVQTVQLQPVVVEGQSTPVAQLPPVEVKR